MMDKVFYFLPFQTQYVSGPHQDLTVFFLSNNYLTVITSNIKATIQTNAFMYIQKLNNSLLVVVR
jgi:hypothetical protein